MAMSVGQGGDDDHSEVMSSINTTPLVDVMLVLLIIFLITIPVVSHTVPVDLPKERVEALQTTPQNVILSVTRDGDVYWGEHRVPDRETLVARLKEVSVKNPQPQVNVRGDLGVRYEAVGQVIVAVQRAGIAKVSFITQPPARG
ncbi:biopolymer transporter ExbD [Pandoraea horticolens]|uniref:Biopolymer transporter ExbD n=1 Tax=Pandoraea horticolens TaxID=2508298 RepID=A0A5E4VPB8_9BURK|nr:biopolymer transporter ExbD [Pandoraea horticolens]VVE14257.1 biopolymer transporter ExbD [Pandoraea horticolens]